VHFNRHVVLALGKSRTRYTRKILFPHGKLSHILSASSTHWCSCFSLKALRRDKSPTRLRRHRKTQIRPVQPLLRVCNTKNDETTVAVSRKVLFDARPEVVESVCEINLEQRKMMLRRGAAAKRSTTESSELFSTHLTGSSSSQQLESVEVGRGSITTTTTLKNEKSHTANGIHPTNGIIEGSTRQRQRRKFGRPQQSFLLVLRQLLSRLRHKPSLAKQLLVCVTSTFLLFFLISLVVTAMMQRNVENQSKASVPAFQTNPHHQIHPMVSEPPTKHKLATSPKRKLETGKTTKNSFFETSKTAEFIPQFDVIFRKNANRVGHSGIAGTDKLDSTDVLDGRQADYEDLEMQFFEENGAIRQIFHDYEARETHYRSPTTNRDDDTEMCVAAI
jgi:hypothetical protein